MSNEAKKFRSQKVFRKIISAGHEIGGLEIGDVLDLFTKKQGVACDGKINGIKWATSESNDPTATLTLSFETINGGNYMVLRDCTGAIVFQVTGALASASPSPSPSASPSASASRSASPSVSRSVSPSSSGSPSLSPSSSTSLSVSPSASTSPSGSLSPSASVSPSSSSSGSPSPSASVSPSSSVSPSA